MRAQFSTVRDSTAIDAGKSAGNCAGVDMRAA
jgi:hypothetical protein